MNDPGKESQRPTEPLPPALGERRVLADVAEELRSQREEVAHSRAALVRERERYRSIFEHAPVPYLITDAAGMVREANRAAAELLGVPARALAGAALAAFVPPAGRQGFQRKLLMMRAREDATSFVLRLVPLRALPRLAMATVCAVREGGEVRELRWLLVDETERRLREHEVEAMNRELEARVAERATEYEAAAAEREELLRQAELERQAAERANRSTTQLLAMVSQELRAPLAAISGYSELLLVGVHGTLSERQVRDVERIRQAQEHIRSLVDDLLAYLRPGSGALRLDPADVPLAEVLAHAGALVAPQAQARHVECGIPPAEPSLLVHVDAARVRQILLNLLSSAVQHSPRGGRVEVSWRSRDSQVEVQVHDNGPGVPHERLERIFEPLVPPRGAAPRPPGLGLGLALSRELARAMGGDLTVESGAGDGATFTLVLPRAKVT